jgi:hypothetical protein
MSGLTDALRPKLHQELKTMVHETCPDYVAVQLARGETEVDAVHDVVLGILSNGFLPNDDCIARHFIVEVMME